MKKLERSDFWSLEGRTLFWVNDEPIYMASESDYGCWWVL